MNETQNAPTLVGPGASCVEIEVTEWILHHGLAANNKRPLSRCWRGQPAVYSSGRRLMCRAS